MYKKKTSTCLMVYSKSLSYHGRLDELGLTVWRLECCMVTYFKCSNFFKGFASVDYMKFFQLLNTS